MMLIQHDLLITLLILHGLAAFLLIGALTHQTISVWAPIHGHIDSFFDVFIEMDTSMGPLHNTQPVHLQAVINCIPPQIPRTGRFLLRARITSAHSESARSDGVA